MGGVPMPPHRTHKWDWCGCRQKGRRRTLLGRDRPWTVPWRGTHARALLAAAAEACSPSYRLHPPTWMTDTHTTSGRQEPRCGGLKRTRRRFFHWSGFAPATADPASTTMTQCALHEKRKGDLKGWIPMAFCDALAKSTHAPHPNAHCIFERRRRWGDGTARERG
jgi:hypothetical protein